MLKNLPGENVGSVSCRVQHHAYWFAAASSLLLVALGAAALAGWFAPSKALLPALRTVKVNTAVAFLLAGIILALQLRPPLSGRRAGIVQGAATLIAALGALTLVEYAFGLDLKIDQLLLRALRGKPAAATPERMGPTTAVALMLLGMASLLLDSGSVKLRRASEMLAIAALIIAFVTGIGYLLSVSTLHGVSGYAPMSVSTALGCALVSLGTLAARPRRGVLATLLRDNAAGATARRVMPLMTVAALITAWLLLRGQQAGLYGPELGLALMVAAFTSVLSSIVLRNAKVIAIGEETRQDAEVAKQTMTVLVDSSDDAIMSKTLDGLVQSWNPGAERLFGYRAEAIIGQGVKLLLPEDRGDEESMIDDWIRRGQRVAHFETVRRRMDGSLVDVSLTISPLRDHAGAIVGSSTVMRNITERGQVAEQLRSLNAQLEEQVRLRSEELRSVRRNLTTILDALPSIIAYWDKDLVNHLANRAFCELYFKSGPDSIRGLNMREVFDADILRNSLPHVEAALRGEPQTYERTRPGRDGAPPTHQLLHMVPDVVDGLVQGFYVVGHDVTAITEAKRLLTESEKFLQRVERLSGVGGFMLDLATHAQRWTGQTYRIHDYLDENPPPVVNLEDGFVSAPVRDYWQETLRNARENGAAYDIELPIVTAQKRDIWIRVVGEVERDDGKPVRVVGAVQDVTERRAMEQNLREASASADKANKAKSEFLANMSHEIRTPLNAIIGLGYLLEQTLLSEDQRQFLTKIQFAGRALLGVINSVLDLSKIEAGEMLLEDEPFDMPALLRDLTQMLTPQAATKGIRLTLELAENLPPFMMGDESRLRQILINLLSNAIKFTEVGHVTLKVFCTEQASDHIRLRCEVEDTGIGIESATLQRLFTPFTQADASTTRRFGGTGLGLSIARRFVELMGGEIDVTSTPAVGTTFWFEIPLHVAPDHQAAIEAPRGLRVFVADSIGDAPEGLGVMVRALGWSPAAVGTVEHLVTSLRDAPQTGWPDVLIVEAQADTDVGRLIAQFERECSHSELPPVVVVANDSDLHPEQQQMRSEDVLLLKPVTSSSLFNAINTAVWKRTDSYDRVLRSTELDALRAQWLAGVRVLVVDDSDTNREVAQRILEKQGAIIVTCDNGETALEYMRIHHKEIDLVLMDVQMPVLDGIEATRRMRGELALDTLPIIALTGGALLGERQRALESGMNDFLSKPFDPQTLILKTRRLVEQARGQPIPMVLVHSNPGTPASDVALISGIDSGIVQRMFGEDLSLFKSLLARMLRDFADLALPVTFIDQATREELMARTHKLKGSAGMIGATGVMRFASAAETALQQDRSVAVVEKILRELASALTTLHENSAPMLESVDLKPETSATRALSNTVPSMDATAQMLELQGLLESQDLAATDQYNALSQTLRELLGETRFEELNQAIDDLDFSLAARLLRKAISPGKRVGLPQSG